MFDVNGAHHVMINYSYYISYNDTCLSCNTLHIKCLMTMVLISSNIQHNV